MIHYIRYVCGWLVILLLPAIALAQCPTQETVILYLNGADTTRESSIKSKERIEDEVLKEPSVIKDCVTFDRVYNTNEPLFLDFMEAFFQKAREQGWDVPDFWRMFFRLNPITSAFADLLADYYSSTNSLLDLGLFVLGDQVEEHLEEYRKHLPNKQIIIVAHSQGVSYVNDEWNLLTDAEKSQVNVIAVATPTDHIAGNGPYTTLAEDKVAELFFPRALAANIANDEECPDNWTCHGFKESYMRGDNSRTRIVEQIVALLPTAQPSCRIEGAIYNGDLSLDYPGGVSGASITLWNYWSGDPVFQTVSDSSGRYCIGNVADDDYAIDVNYDDQLFGINEAHLPGATEPLIIDIVLYAPM